MNYVKNKYKKCTAPKCDRKAVCKGYCYKHYQQIRLRGKLIEKGFVSINGICKNLGCGRKIFAKGLCQRCYLKLRKERVKDET